MRYEKEIGHDRDSNEIGIDHETLLLIPELTQQAPREQILFPDFVKDVTSIFVQSGGKKTGSKPLIKKTKGSNDNYYPEGAGKSFKPSFRLGRTRSALANLPADEASFPACLWFRELLESGIQSFILDSQVIRQPSPPGQGRGFQTDGSNLPWVIHDLSKTPKRFDMWIEHVQTALEDILSIRTIEREEDRHRYLVIDYANGASVPSWLVSDGTLRLLALTIPAYLSDMRGVFLIEEPENGIHPKAMETVIQSLTSIYEGQVLIATHSPIVMSLLNYSQILCFAKDENGATDIVSGDQHPRLQEWKQGEPDLGTLFATGILS